jgi:hypothetical protein
LFTDILFTDILRIFFVHIKFQSISYFSDNSSLLDDYKTILHDFEFMKFGEVMSSTLTEHSLGSLTYSLGVTPFDMGHKGGALAPCALKSHLKTSYFPPIASTRTMTRPLLLEATALSFCSAFGPLSTIRKLLSFE